MQFFIGIIIFLITEDKEPVENTGELRIAKVLLFCSEVGNIRERKEKIRFEEPFETDILASVENDSVLIF